jgi:hypothetical protein
MRGDLPFARANSIVSDLSSSREELSVLVETSSHDPIRGIKRLLNTVAMVHVNVDVENSRVIPGGLVKLSDDQAGYSPQQLQDTKDDV